MTYFAGYNEQISGLKCILARRIWNCLLPPAIILKASFRQVGFFNFNDEMTAKINKEKKMYTFQNK